MKLILLLAPTLLLSPAMAVAAQSDGKPVALERFKKAVEGALPEADKDAFGAGLSRLYENNGRTGSKGAPAYSGGRARKMASGRHKEPTPPKPKAAKTKRTAIPSPRIKEASFDVSKAGFKIGEIAGFVIGGELAGPSGSVLCGAAGGYVGMAAQEAGNMAMEKLGDVLRDRNDGALRQAAYKQQAIEDKYGLEVK